MQFLLSDTVIDTRINVNSTSEPFASNVGTPQRDSLNPALFSVIFRTCSQRSPTYTAETKKPI